jgi:hypothetical protein
MVRIQSIVCLSKQRFSSGAQIGTSKSIEYTWINTDRLIDAGEREFELAVTMQDEATLDAGGGRVRIERDSLIEIGNRSITVAVFIPD